LLIRILTCWLVATTATSAQDAATVADSIFTAAAGRGPGAYEQAAEQIARLAEANPDNATAHALLGALYLRLENGDGARMALERATGLDSTLAGAHFGLGRVLLELEDKPKESIPHFEAALTVDSTYADALAQLALAYHRSDKRRDARRAADRAIKLDPRLAAPYRILAETYVEGGNTKASLIYFKRYLDLNPKDEETAYAFARHLHAQGQWEDLFQVTSRLKDARSLPLLAVSLIHKGEHEGAMQAFQDYTATLEEEETELYEDITFVGLKREVQAYRTVPPTARDAFLEQFWMRRDPFKTSGGSMRRAEHYRRVWHAREVYGVKRYPWDRRGEVYIRYGEPDWISTSKSLNAITPPAVQQVQDMMAARLYGSESVDHSFVGPVFPIRHQSDAGLVLSNPSVDDGELLGLQGFKPITASSDWSTVPWESWVYTDVGGGLEISFTDEFLSNNYDFAPIPTLSEDDMTRLELTQGSALSFLSRITEFSPASLVARVASEQPERYDLTQLDPLHFYFEALAYRGENGQTDLQVNIALPIDNVALPEDPDTTVVVERRVVLLMGSREVIRFVENLGIGINSMSRDQGLLAVERVNLPVRPGEYELRVQATRRNTNRVQVYGQGLELADFSSPDLALSDLQIAQNIQETNPERPSKFVRNGWDIQPAPTRSFHQGEPLFVYYEIYNLMRNEFGQTRYKIAYEVETRTSEGKIKIPFLAKLRRKEGEKIGFEFEQTGEEEMEADYFELDLAEAKVGRYELRMRVTDLDTGQETSRSTVFSVIP
tara:strand:+ start:4153 stop:6486 length:2334 start_codon:yes stop_codon:yes gene_type:complete